MAYRIQVTAVTKRPTGQKDKYGRKKWETVNTKTHTEGKKVTFKDMKMSMFEAAKKNKNVYVDYGDRLSIRKTRVINSVTTKNPDGTKTVQYFKKVKEPKKNTK